MASQPITITVPWPAAALNPNSRVHWSKLAKLKKKAKADAIWATAAAVPVGDRQLGPGPLKVTILANPPTVRNRDDDNLIAACKAYFDGLAFALNVDDSQFRRPTIEWGATKRGGDLVFVITKLESAPTCLARIPGADGDAAAATGTRPTDLDGTGSLAVASPDLFP